MQRRGTTGPRFPAPAKSGGSTHTVRSSVPSPGNPSTGVQSSHGATNTTTFSSTKPLRGLLKLLQGQIATDSVVTRTFDDEAVVSVYRYHGPTLRKSQKDLQKQKKHRAAKRSGSAEKDDGDSPLLHSRHPASFPSVVGRHKFVAFFVVQGLQSAGGNRCYSAHTLNLRSLLATEYHDVLSTLVLDLGGSGGDHVWLDEETAKPSEDNDNNDDVFCKGTGVGVFPATPLHVSTILAMLHITKIPSVVVLDSFTGRIVSGDAILPMERNDPHTVVNRWQAGYSGLSPLQTLGAMATCDCSHGPCCSNSGGCVIQ